MSDGTGILKDISFLVLGQVKDKNLAWRACLENDLIILINSVDESFPIILPGLYVLSPIIGNFFDDRWTLIWWVLPVSMPISKIE